MKVENEIRLRNVRSDTIARIDQLAAAQGKSRNEYIKILLDTHVVFPEIREIQSQYETLLEKVLAVLRENTRILNKLQKSESDF